MNATLLAMSAVLDPVCAWLYTPPKPKPKKTRSKPMEVLCLGLSRSGTGTLTQALTELGYDKAYHGLDNVMNPQYGWLKAAKAKYQGTEPMTREDWDNMLGDCMSVSDLFAAANAEELMDMYPDAKVILSVRDVDKWFESYRKNIAEAMGNGATILSRCFQPDMWILRYSTVMIHNHIFRGNLDLYGKQAYREHNAMVRGMAMKRGMPFLEFDVQDGWEPLCKFLEKPVPDHPLPHENLATKLGAKIIEKAGPKLQRAQRRMYVFLATLAVLSAATAWTAWRKFLLHTVMSQIKRHTG